MISKIEFISKDDVNVASPTVLATYTKIYNPQLSTEENNSPIGYFVQETRTLSFELDKDSFLVDDVFDSSNDEAVIKIGFGSTREEEPEFRVINNKAIKVYNDDNEYFYMGLLLPLPSNLRYTEDKKKIYFKFNDGMLEFSNGVNFANVGIRPSISIILSTLILWCNYSFNLYAIAGGAKIPVVKDFTYRSNITFTDYEIGNFLDWSSGFLGYQLTEEVNYFDIIRVRGYAVRDSGTGDYTAYYSYIITTYEKTEEGTTYESSVFEYTDSNETTAKTEALSLMNDDINTRGYSDVTLVTVDDSLTVTSGDKYEVVVTGSLGDLTLSFTGQDFVTALDFVDSSVTKFSDALDVITILHNLQIQVKIDSDVPKFYITNKDTIATDKGVLNPNDVCNLEYDRVEIEKPKLEVFEILSSNFATAVKDGISTYYKQYTEFTNRKITFSLSEVLNTYSLNLDDKFTFDSVDWKVSKIKQTAQKSFDIEAWIISQGIEVLYPTGGEEFKTGNTYQIQWRTISINDDENIKIELWKSGALDSTIVASTANDGSYDWDTTGLADSTEYQIKLLLVSDNTITDITSNFSVLLVP